MPPNTHPEDFSGLGGSARGFPLKPGILQDLERCTWGSLGAVALLSPGGVPSSAERLRPLSLAWGQGSEVKGMHRALPPPKYSHCLLPTPPCTARLWPNPQSQPASVSPPLVKPSIPPAREASPHLLRVLAGPTLRADVLRPGKSGTLTPLPNGDARTRRLLGSSTASSSEDAAGQAGRGSAGRTRGTASPRDTSAKDGWPRSPSPVVTVPRTLTCGVPEDPALPI